MSACLFIIGNIPEKSSDELEALKIQLIKTLAIDPDLGNRYQTDKWSGQEITLGRIYIELNIRFEKRFNNIKVKP